MEGFVNEYVSNSQIWPALVVFVPIALIIFSYLYNRLMDQLNTTREHLSLYVVGGVLVTLIGVGVFSWKAALLCGICFSCSGPFMIYGEFKRTATRRTTKPTLTVRVPRRKRLPYAANGRIEDAFDAVKEANRLLGVAFKASNKIESTVPLAEAGQQLNNAIINLAEVKVIQLGDE